METVLNFWKTIFLRLLTTYLIILFFAVTSILVIKKEVSYAQCQDTYCIYLPTSLKPAPLGSFSPNSWPTIFQNNSRNGHNPYEKDLTKDLIKTNGLQLAWTYNLNNQPSFGGTSAIIATNLDNKTGVVYFPDSKFVSLDLETGQPLTFTTKHTPRESLTIDEQNVYYSTYINAEPYIVASNRHTGDTVWTYKIFDSASSAPTVSGNAVYVLSRDKNIYVLNKNNGTLLWKYLTGDRFANQTAAISGTTLYAQNEDDGLYALEATTGALKWRYPLGLFSFSYT
jgi:outer membrane protein assembly factor BamB